MLLRFFISCVLLLCTLVPLASYASSADDILGAGFTDTENYTTARAPITSDTLEARGHSGLSALGLRESNALFYNATQLVKWFAGSVAFLFILISLFRAVGSSSEETIEQSKQGVLWACIGLVFVVSADLLIVALFEAGGMKDFGHAGLITKAADGSFTANIAVVQNATGYFLTQIHYLFNWGQVMAAGLAVIFIVIAGIRMITAGGDEESITKSKTYLLHVITAFVVFLLLKTFIFEIIYPSAQFAPDGSVHILPQGCIERLDFAATEALKNEGASVSLAQNVKDQCASLTESGLLAADNIRGVIRFFETIIGAIAIFFIVYAGLRIIGAFGDDAKMDEHKKQIYWSVAGLAVVILSEQVVLRFFFVPNYLTGEVTQNISQGVVDIAGVINFVLTFVAIGSTVSLVAASFLWVANFGNTELADKARSIVLGALAGVVLSIAAYAVTNTLVSGQANQSSAGSEFSIGG